MRNLLRAVAVSALLIGLSQADAQTICCSGGGGGGAVTFPLNGANGTSAAPSYGFTNGTDSGMYANTNGSVTVVGAKGAVGGAVSLTGGSPVSGNIAGGAVNLTGGAASTAATTALGGNVNITPGPGVPSNSAPGNVVISSPFTPGFGGGVVLITGGLAAPTVDAMTLSTQGGRITIQPGPNGIGSGNTGGTLQLAGGIVNQEGNGGAVAITGGAAATITAANRNGGNINLTGGTAINAGTPGEIQINGDSSIMVTNIRYQALDPTNNSFFTATRPVLVKAILCRVNAPTGAVATLTVLKAPSGTALSGGTALHTGTFDANGTANTNQTLSLSGTVATLNLAAGDSIGVTTTGTWTTGTGSCTVHMQPK